MRAKARASENFIIFIEMNYSYCIEITFFNDFPSRP